MTALPFDVPTDLFIGGSWRPATGGRTVDVTDPADGAVLATVADATAEDAVAALDAAAAAQQDWAATAPRERSDVLRAAFDAITARADDFARLMTLEMGKPLAESLGEVTYGAEFLRWFSEEAVRVGGRHGVRPEGGAEMVVRPHPVGPCLLITPWNFPLAMATRKLGPALAAGCTVVLKPATLTPLTTLAAVRVLEQAGLPAGVVNVLTTTDAAAVTEPLMADRRLRKVSFTGSTPVGRTLLGQAAANVLRTSMELGGNAPFLVFDDADLDTAVTAAMQAKFRNVGQACTAANRFLVQRGIADRLVERLTAAVDDLVVGRGTDEGVTIGPLVSDGAVAKCVELVQDAVRRGATLVRGGRALDGPGHFLEPALLTDVPADARICSEEVFGPVLAITVFDTEDEAVALADDTEFGLASYVCTSDLTRARRVVDRLEVGMAAVNLGVLSNAAAPFGGVKQSGLGREGGSEGIAEYQSLRYTLSPL
ncbi:NAD-dependent succinate-semialdehyde dehydrogenase [Auraticoccus monumenti]|uniref:Succinate-semialdehyde dehydrogenase / glutarate-semialdehyde dehydrogenase n=1 Tax=Auraticoccus monumenti TaxID=675864 RepID=A0A1G6SLH8_9ACTN|nr:NAD-dependent succinate-semialdehyde dehydrogenase [Auraticoccus monumenti]SDD17643.1 succinate-semialdehyde dehydrogenase / glutarate-semialdehyde dehydrogenase [Auraticoccus monumenti]